MVGGCSRESDATLGGEGNEDIEVPLCADAQNAGVIDPQAASGSSRFSALAHYVPSLSRVADVATIICIIDCTVFPLLLMILSVLDIANLHSLEFVHGWSHWITMFIVLPIGTIAVVANYLRLRVGKLLLWGAFGLTLIFVSHHNESKHSWMNALVSLFGGINLIASNVVSRRKLACQCPQKCCRA